MTNKIYLRLLAIDQFYNKECNQNTSSYFKNVSLKNCLKNIYFL